MDVTLAPELRRNKSYAGRAAQRCIRVRVRVNDTSPLNKRKKERKKERENQNNKKKPTSTTGNAATSLAKTSFKWKVRKVAEWQLHCESGQLWSIRSHHRKSRGNSKPTARRNSSWATNYLRGEGYRHAVTTATPPAQTQPVSNSPTRFQLSTFHSLLQPATRLN